MVEFVLRRIGLAIVVAFCVSLLSFALLLLSGDPAVGLAGESADEATIMMVREQYGLDRPLAVQYWLWLQRVVALDFGTSLLTREPVLALILDRIPVTITLAVCSLALALLLSIPLGVVAALRPDSTLDRAALGFATVGQAVPNFWLALMLMVLFGIEFGWLPVSGSGTWQHFVMPTLVLGTAAMPAFMRLTRAGMIEALASDYVRTARAKGLLWRSVLFKHALRNAMLPVVTVAAVQLGFMLSGSVVVETVFSLNGLGFLAWQSLSVADLPMIQAIVLLASLTYVVLTTLADVLNALLDPRLRPA
jgi:peptide/nickel transport system permease protein